MGFSVLISLSFCRYTLNETFHTLHVNSTTSHYTSHATHHITQCACIYTISRYTIASFTQELTMQISITPTDNNKYYVYIVKDQDGGILYINADKIINIVSFKQLLPDPRFNTSGIYDLDILTAHQQYFDALNTVNQLIKDLCPHRIPPFNLSQHYNRNANVICNTTGVIYRNASTACRALDIHSPRMSNHLRQKAGHKTIKGLTFSYIEGTTGVLL